MRHLSGDAGIARMEAAISDTRTKYFQALENGSPVGSPVVQITSPISASIPTSQSNENTRRPNHVARRLFRDEANISGGGPQNSSGVWTELENELIVNESVHGQQLVLDEGINFEDKSQSSAKVSGASLNLSL